MLQEERKGAREVNGGASWIALASGALTRMPRSSIGANNAPSGSQVDPDHASAILPVGARLQYLQAAFPAVPCEVAQ